MDGDKSEIKYPIGVQNFTKLREEGFLYVDKTADIYPLLKGNGFYFLSRPRRFGKSLLLSTIEAYYQGRRDLFKGLALDSLTDDWDPHPVLHLDLNSREYLNRESLVSELNAHLERWEERYGCAKPDRSPEERFSNVILRAYEQTGKKVAVLIDEYDKPLLSALHKDDLAEEYRSLLKAFYGNLKSMDAYIEICVMTGVARFSKVSIFSDINNLRDISFENRFSTICGITSEELDHYFQEGIKELSAEYGSTRKEIRERLRHNYDGYHFAKVSPDIYNPFSLVNVFAKRDFGAYWFESGTPTYLIRLIESQQWLLHDLAPVEIGAIQLETSDILSGDPVPSLYQTGYLTIKDYDRDFGIYTLDYPNEEVRDGFVSFLIPYYVKPTVQPGRFSLKKFVLAVTSGDTETFVTLLESMIAGVPYSERGSAEAHFQNALYILFTLMGQYVKIEDRTSDGRIDLTVETSQYVYIFESKVNSTAEEAMAQIRRKCYWVKYLSSGKNIRLIGLNFDTKMRRINDYVIEEP